MDRFIRIEYDLNYHGGLGGDPGYRGGNYLLVSVEEYKAKGLAVFPHDQSHIVSVSEDELYNSLGVLVEDEK